MNLSQKELKHLKKEVVDYSALEVGYFEGILSALPPYALFEGIRELSGNGWVNHHTEDALLQNMLVTEAIKALNYQDFKQVAPYLFSYPKEQREAFFYVQPVAVSRPTYEWLKSQADELFSLKADIEATRESLERKIEELETDRLPNGDQVLGFDKEARELLLLRAPETSYIDGWKVEREGLLYDYRLSHDYASQALKRLTAAYPEIRLLVREAVLNRDKIDDMIIIDDELLPEETLHLLPSFKTHRNYYAYGQRFPDFKGAYPNYEAYINTIYERHYPTDYGQEFWAMSLLPKCLPAINDQLAAYGKELVTYTTLDNWEDNRVHHLAYLRDLETETSQDVVDYLEHTVGAYLGGRLGELAVIKLDNIDPERGYNGKAEKTLFVDHGLLEITSRSKLATIQQLHPELGRFTAIEHTKHHVQDKEVRQSSPGLTI